MHVTLDEITPGLVVRLDTTAVRTLGGSQTNAVLGPEGDRAVVGSHDFLIVGLDAASARCTAVPLFAKTAVGNQPLENGKKSGLEDQWIETETFFSRWQHWRLPLATVVAASGEDMATMQTRRRYAAADRSALDDIKNWEGRNRAAYRDAH
jgi:hypothetical protein